MAETDTFPLDPDYEPEFDESDGVVRQRAEGGRAIQWQQRPAVRTFTLAFKERSTDEVEQLRDWKRRFAASFFIFHHKTWVNNAGVYLARKFPVEWLDDSLPQRMTFNDVYDFQIRLIEAVGRAYPAGLYPDPAAGHPSFFEEETHANAKAAVGVWTFGSDGNCHGGGNAYNSNLNTIDFFTWVYAGCGFRFWNLKMNNRGIGELFLDGVSLGTIDQYAASTIPSAVLLSKLDVALGLHVVKYKATNTKNASNVSGSQYIDADAIEVLP